MRRLRVNPSMFRAEVAENTPLPPLQPYVRCSCGRCHECKDNEKWDRVFAKFAVKESAEERGFFRSPLSEL